MHFCTAKINIGGDAGNVYFANEFDPVSWPEIAVLQFVHGEESVDEIRPFVRVEQKPRAERERLSEKYRDEVVAIVFGGRSPPHEMEAPAATLVSGVLWKNPLTGKEEIAMAGKEKYVEPEPEPENDDDSDPGPVPVTRSAMTARRK